MFPWFSHGLHMVFHGVTVWGTPPNVAGGFNSKISSDHPLKDDKCPRSMSKHSGISFLFKELHVYIWTMYIYIYIYVNIHVYVYNIYIYICIYICIYVYIYVYIYIYAYINVYIYMYTCIYICICGGFPKMGPQNHPFQIFQKDFPL